MAREYAASRWWPWRSRIRGYIEVRLPLSRPTHTALRRIFAFCIACLSLVFLSMFSCFFGNHWIGCIGSGLAAWWGRRMGEEMYLGSALGIRHHRFWLVGDGNKVPLPLLHPHSLLRTGWQEGVGRKVLKSLGYIIVSLGWEEGGTGGQTRDGGIQDSRGRG